MWGCSVFTGLVGFKQRDVEDVMDLLFAGKREAHREGRDDFLNLESTMILVVQLLRGMACFDVSAAKHHQDSYLVRWGVFPGWVGVPAYSFLRFFQSFPGLAMYGVHPMRVDLAGWVEGFC